MRDYSKVAGSFWTGKTGRAIRGDRDAQIVAMYLMTSPHSNMIGVFHCPIIYIAHETGSPLEGATKGLQRLEELGFCTFDGDVETVWVHEMARFQIGDELHPKDKQVLGIQKQYESLPESLIKSGFYAKYHKAFHLTEDKPLQSPFVAPAKPGTGTGTGTGTGAGAGTGTGTGMVPGAEKSAPPPKTEIIESAKPETDLQAACRETWKSYSDAYFLRYEAEPVRNATINTQVKAFVKRIGAEEAPHVAAFFVQSNAAFYVQRGHTFGNLLADAEKLRTEWATGRTMTGTRARQIDATQANYSVVGEAMKILEAQGHEKTA